MSWIKTHFVICLMLSITTATWAGDAEDVEEASVPAVSEETESVPHPLTAENATVDESPAGSSPPPTAAASWDERAEDPWDYSPYRVLVWLVSEDPNLTAARIRQPLLAYLDRDYAAVWRIDLADAPAAVCSAACRDIGGLSYDLITAADPVLAVKRDHKDAVRIRTARNVGELVQKVYATQGRIDEVKRRAVAAGDGTIGGVAARLEAAEGDALAVREAWADEKTEALLVSRGMAMTLDQPEAKLITPPLDDLVSKAVDGYDKIFIVRVRRDVLPNIIDAVEFDTLMRHFGPVASAKSAELRSLPDAIGRAISTAFGPIVRIENAGQRNAVGLLRAGGLIVDDESPAAIKINDVLQPMTRKNDRNGKPILIGPMDWSFLLVTEPEMAALRAVKGAGFRIGDQVVSVSGKSVEIPQRIKKALDEHPAGEKLSIEVDRKGETEKLSIDLSKSSTPLQLQYLGFTAGERRGQVIVTSVMPDAPAEGKLQVGDVIVSVGGPKVSSINSLGRLVISIKSDQPSKPDQPAKPDPPIKLSIQREGATQEVELLPSDISARSRSQVRTIEMDYYAGRAGGLQGRKNKRTFRVALKVRPFRDSSMLRLHLQRDPDFPLIGYELYEKELKSTDMTFIGRTDWNGRLKIERSDDPFRLLYVKNGGAVLARLPIVPGLDPMNVADLSGDDLRLQAEAYIRGVQNAIIDLVAIRELFKARIRLRLERGEMDKAETLMNALREQPSNEKLATDMGRKQAIFLKLLGTKNANQRRKVDEMFTTTRDLLAKHINPKLVRDLENDMITAKKSGGKLPPRKEENEEEE